MEKTTKRTFPIIALVLLILALGALTACGGSSEAETNGGLENFSVATPTPKPTATPVVRAPVSAQMGDDQSSSSSGGNVLDGFIDDPSGQGDLPPVLIDEAAADGGTTDTQPVSTLEPVEISVDLRSGDLNTWIEVSPPPGWRIIQGLDGILLTQRPDKVPDTAFVLVRRWGNVVNLSDYLAYLPDAIEERNSNVAFRMGGYDWDGVFLTSADNRYRAFFGVSADIVPSYTLLVYVPTGLNDNGDPLTREQLLSTWTIEVGDLNNILRRLTFY